MIFIQLILAISCFMLARSKGFNGWFWLFASGLPGLVILAFLMPAKGPRCPPELAEKRAKRGNAIGIIITVVSLMYVIFDRLKQN